MKTTALEQGWTFADLMAWATNRFPYAEISEDDNGELVVSLGVKECCRNRESKLVACDE